MAPSRVLEFPIEGYSEQPRSLTGESYGAGVGSGSGPCTMPLSEPIRNRIEVVRTAEGVVEEPVRGRV